MKIWGTKTCCLQSFMKHCRVRAFEKVNIVLNALLAALGLLQAELQVLQTHLKLFLRLQIEMLVLTSRTNSVQSGHRQRRVCLCLTRERGNPTLCLLWRRSLSSLSLLLFSASNFRILFWRASSLETAWSFTLLTWENPSSFCPKQLTTCVWINNSKSMSINNKKGTALS